MRTRIADRLPRLAPLVLRVVVAIVFMTAGASKLLAPAEASRILAEHGMPWPDVMGTAIGVFELVAGAFLLAGRYVRTVAAVLAANLLVLSFVFHLPFGVSVGASYAHRVELAFDLLAFGALYAVATWRARDQSRATIGTNRTAPRSSHVTRPPALR